MVLFKELEERIKNAARLTYVISCLSLAAKGVNFVEQVNTAHLSHRVEDKSQFRRGLSHELGQDSMEQYGEEGKTQLSG